MTVTNPNCLVVVIDTDRYTGTFERQLVSYATAQLHPYGLFCDSVATKAKPDVKNYDWFEEHTAYIEDENGADRICSIWQTPAALLPKGSRPVEYNSVGYFVDEMPPAEVRKEIMHRAAAFCKENGFGFLGVRVLKPVLEEVVTFRVADHVEVDLS